MKVPCLFVAALCALGVAATDMDQKAKVIATVQTVGAGIAEVTCNDVGNWKFTVSCAQDAGRDVVTVRIESPMEAEPPKFGVFFRVSQGIVNSR